MCVHVQIDPDERFNDDTCVPHPVLVQFAAIEGLYALHSICTKSNLLKLCTSKVLSLEPIFLGLLLLSLVKLIAMLFMCQERGKNY